MIQDSQYHNPLAAAMPPGFEPDDDHAFALVAGLRFWASKGNREALVHFIPPRHFAITLAATRAALAPPDATPTKPRQRTVRIRPPDGLRTEAEAAAKLGISIRTLREHVRVGALPCVDVGHGKQRARRRFNDADIDQFIKNQTREESPCPSIAPRGRSSTTTTFGGSVIGFSALQKRKRDAKPKK